MKLIRHPRPRIDLPEGCVATLGNFDGFHRGHQRLVDRLVRVGRSRRRPSVVVTFDPHPAVVLAPHRAPSILTNRRQRLILLASSDIDRIVLLHFSRRVANIEAEDFVRDFLSGTLGVIHMVVGPYVGYGRGREGDVDHLRRLSGELGFSVEVVPSVECDGRRVSSSSIREALRRGQLDVAERMLGRPYAVMSRVVHGHHRGKKLGIPTANLRPRGLELPPDGVYAVRVRVSGQEPRPAVANVGTNPTFGDTERALEVHLFDFDADLYGRRLEVAFVRMLRGEVRFPDVAALVAQIHADIAEARRILA